MQIKNTKDIAAAKIKILVHAPSGAGKTRLCGTAPGKVLILSAESGLLSLAGQDIDVVDIKGMEEFFSVLEHLQNDMVYDFVCIDSISEIAEVCLTENKLKFNDPRQAYGEMQEQVIRILRGYRDLPKNIYVSAKQERTKDEVTGGMIFGPSAPGTKVGPALPYLFDEVFTLHTFKDEEGNIKRALQTQRDNQYEAKDRSGKLDFFEKPNLTYIINKIKGVK